MKIIVSRHPAAIEFIARELGGTVTVPGFLNGKQFVNASTGEEDEPPFLHPVLAQATADDVRGKHVYGNLPLHLAALASRVTVIEFTGDPPRGQEYTLAEMEAAGAVLRSYIVQRAPSQDIDCWEQSGRAPEASPAQIRADHADLRAKYGETRF